MDEREFRRRFQESVGEAPVPPDLAVSARRALSRPAPRQTSPLLVLAAVASVLLLALAGGYYVLLRLTAVPVRPAPAAPTPSPAAAGEQPCQTADLEVTGAFSQGAAGHLFMAVTFKNTGTATCSMEGFASAQLVAADGSQIPTRVVGQGGMLGNTPPPTPVHLAPGQSASFQVSWGDVNVGNETCADATSLELAPPGQSPDPAHELKSVNMHVCNSGELDESAVQPSA